MPSDIPALYQEKSCFPEATKQISRNIHMMVLQLYHLPPPLPPPVSSSSCLFTQFQPLYASCCTVLLYISKYCEMKNIFFIFHVFLMYYQCEKDYKPIVLQVTLRASLVLLSLLAEIADGKAPVYDVGDSGSIPGSGRFPGEGNGNPLQYYCLENPMNRGAWWATVHGSQRVRHD